MKFESHINIILPSMPGLPNGLFHSSFPANVFYVFLIDMKISTSKTEVSIFMVKENAKEKYLKTV
jgi:hypothetical protein